MGEPGAVRIAADVGGTFTDILLRLPDGSLAVHKVLSTPPNYDLAVVEGVRELVERSGASASLVEEVVHGTTVATNAVLEHRGARTALVTTRGFRDVLELRRVRMPHLYDPFWTKPPPLVERRLRLEVDERMSAAGEVLRALDAGEVRSVAARLRKLGVESVAVCLLHGHRYPLHEQEIGRILREELPGVPVSLSSEILREQQEYERTAASVVNAYVRPLMERYLDDIRDGLDALGIEGPLTIMQSSGGVMTSEAAATRPVFALESGPAAGVVAALGLAQDLGIENVITFDMGGTTAKASLIEGGRISRSREYEVGASLSAGSRLLRGSGELIRIPTIDIAEVGAGGGSIAWLDTGGGLHVGPRSAGADPGPACYGRGGDQPTVTDANVVLGYIPTGRLASGDLSVSRDLASEAVGGLAKSLGLTETEVARGVHELASATMMRALRSVSSEKGRDPSEFALIAYGGSGPVHAAGLAAELGVQTVIVPPHAGLFSAAGLLFARSEFHDVRFCQLDGRAPDLDVLLGLDAQMRGDLEAAIGAWDTVDWVRSADLRYAGQSWDIEVDFPLGEIDGGAIAEIVKRFEHEHERVYGVRPEEGSPVEIRALRLAVLGPARESALRVPVTDPGGRAPATRRADFGPAHDTVETPVLARDAVTEEGLDGPVLIDEYDTTIVVPPGWHVARNRDGAIVLTSSVRLGDAAGAHSGAGADAIVQEIVGNAFASIADEMATTVFRTAHSTVVRDVMDFSAALCGPTGETIAQAVTIPLHLGSIPTAMRSLLARYGGAMEQGDVFIMNDPFDGGMHTPDIFVVKPVFHGGDVLVGYAVTVAHHGDVGGRLPGSSATDNTEIFQEGLRLPWMHLYRRNEPVDDLVRIIRANVRIPRMTMGDINAQTAACNIAERALQELAGHYGTERLTSLMKQLVDRTERIVRAEIAGWPDGTASFVDWVGSDGIDVRDVKIAVDVTISGDEVTVDFSDSAPMVAGALNSTRSFTEATVFQAVMSAVSVDIPTSSGAFRPVNVITKPGTVTHVVMPGASTMRGVTGFRMFDAVNGALAQLVPDRVAAAGEGGNTLAIFAGTRPDGERFIYFELVVGTWGARPGIDGNDGLSNPCATAANIPVEVAESEFPIMIERYGLVQDSGGAGRYRGGLAIERVWRTVVPNTSLQVRSDRQVHPPYGLAGGGPGGTSANTLLNGSTAPESYPPMFSTMLEHPTTYHHRMAGGGGWGDPLDREVAAVVRDVLDEKVSVGSARDDYGVVVSADGVVDEQATAALRAREGGAMTDLNDHTDTAVVVVGGGILGAVTAWDLARAGVPCILLESKRFGHESTGKSAAIVRTHYSNPQVVRMALRSRQAFIDIPELLGADPVYNRTGWIFLVDEHDREHAIANRAMQTAEGSHSVEVPLDELGEYLPGVSCDGITYALFEEDSGSADPSATTAAYVSAARRLGAYAYEHAPVTEIVVEGDAVKGVRVKGQVIACETVVLAAGGWSPALARTAGIDLPIRLTREQDVVFHTGTEAPPPMSVSAQVDRTYMRPLVEEGTSLLLVGRGFPKPYDYVTTDDCNWDLDQVFVDDVRTRVTGRFPALRELKLRDGRVGLYSVTPDWHPLLGPVDEVEGLHLATGGSGHCFKLGPAIGAMVAGAILGTPVDYADIRDFRLGRFAAGETFQSTYGGNRA